MHALGLLLLVGAVAFAFGENAAKFLVGAVLILGGIAFGAVMFMIVMGMI